MRDGSKYLGQVSKSLGEDLQHGWGTSRWPNGAKYQGKWSNGEANGQGVYTFKYGASVKATFCNNKAQGDGFFTDLLGPQKKINFVVYLYLEKQIKLKSDSIKQIELENFETLPSHEHKLERYILTRQKIQCKKINGLNNCLSIGCIFKGEECWVCKNCKIAICIDCAKADKFRSTDLDLHKMISDINQSNGWGMKI